MSNYEKQNFEPGQILKAEHLNNMESGIETNDAAIAQLSEEVKGAIAFSYKLANRGYVCTKTYDEIKDMVKKSRGLSARLYHTFTPSDSEDAWASWLSCLVVRLIANTTTLETVFAFTFFDYLENKNITLLVNPDNTITEETA